MYEQVMILSELCEVITKGTTPTTLGYEFQEKGIGFLKIECFDEAGNFIPDKMVYISEECNEKMKRSQLKQNDILFSIAGAIGRVAIVSENMLPANTNQALAIIRIKKDNIFIPYIKLILTSNIVKDQYNKQKQGVAQLNLSLQDIRDLRIPICSYEKQIQYVNLFNSIRKLIGMYNSQLEAYDTLVKSQFVELFGNPIDNTKGLPTVPLGEACYLKAGITTAAETIHDQSEEYPIPCYGGNGIRGYVKEATQSGRYPIIGRQGALCGNVQMATGQFHATEHAVLVTPLIESNVVWIYYLLKFMDLHRYHTGAAQPGLAVKTLNTVEIPIAEIALQEQFAAFVEQTDKLKIAIQKSLDEMQLLFDCLMQKYFG